MAGVVAGRVSPSPLEAALVDLARKSVEAPARLGPGDLAPLRTLSGDAALEYALVLAAFHFINRIADLLQVDPEVPGLAWLRRVEPVRRTVVRMMSLVIGRMDLQIRPYARSFDDVAAGFPAADRVALEPLRSRPHVLEAIWHAVEERDRRSTLGPETLARVHAAVEAALPSNTDEATGFHARPDDPVLAFAFVGTRYAQRTTDAMIAALRARGYDDLRLLDLAIAVADANQWARVHRLLGLPARLYDLSGA